MKGGGFRVLNFPEGHRYEGQVDEAELPHGKGLLKFKSLETRNSQIYEGNFCHGERHGRGVVLYSTGDIFEGEFRNSEAYFGVFRWASGSRYMGHFQNNTFHTLEGETSTKVECTGAVLFGRWVNGTLQGWTAIVLPDSYYYCFIENNRRQGEITTFWWSGDAMTATYIDNSRRGPASYIWANGDEWRGTFHSHNDATGVKTEQATGKLVPLRLEFSGTETLGVTRIHFFPVDST